MSDENKCAVDGVTYVQTPGTGCTGCAGAGKPDLCEELASCASWGRDSASNVIWIAEQPTPPVGYVVWLPGRVPDRMLVIDHGRAVQLAAEHHTTFAALREV